MPLNLEMAATPEMLAIALKTKPHAACLVPEKRTERTTEGGLDVAGQADLLAPFVAKLGDAGIQVSLFIAPELRADRSRCAHRRAGHRDSCRPLVRGACRRARARGGCGVATHRRRGANAAHELGLEVHAGHGLDYTTAATISGLSEIVELNIGHILVGEAIFVGLAESVRRMRAKMDGAREMLRHSDTEAEVGGT